MANEQQIPKLLATLVEHQRLFELLRITEAQWAIQNPSKAIKLICEAIAKQEMSPPLKDLEFLGTITMAEQKGNFVAKGRFEKGDLGITEVDPKFETWFSSLVENPSYRMALSYFNIPSYTSDIELAYLLGKETRCPVSLRHVYMLLENHSDGEESPLVTDGSWNRFYVVDSLFELRQVEIGWITGGWSITAETFARSYGGSTNGIVFSS